MWMFDSWVMANHIQFRGWRASALLSSLILTLFYFENILIHSSRNNVSQVARCPLDRVR